MRETPKVPQPDQIIAGRYRIVSRLGSGGMGQVFLAEPVNGGPKVAMKFLEPEPGGDDSRVARFLREARVALELQHPGAVQVLDLGRDESSSSDPSSMRLFMCFELVEGEDLRELLKHEGRLTFSEARDVTLQVAKVLAHAHARGIVHRDVKPENLSVRRDQVGIHVKVLDFGIARLLKDAGVRLTAEGMLAGTPRYMAPEQVNDEPITAAVDQYALGLVFFELLTGLVAVGGKNISQILMHQLKTPVPTLEWVDPELAYPAIDAFLARACAKPPRDRFPSMEDFIADLERLPVDAQRWPAPKPPAREAVSTHAQTRAMPVEGLSDTAIRPPAETQLERKHEVPTDPWRAPVKKAHAPDESPTDPARKSTSRPDAPVAPPVHEALEMPTDPERPAVSRRAATVPSKVGVIRQTVAGGAAAAPSRRPWISWLVGLTIAAVGLGLAFWLTRR